MGKASEFLSGLQTSIKTAVDKAMPFRAIVDHIEDGKVVITPLGSDTALEEPYARVQGFELNPGDEVAVTTLSGKPFVLGKIQRSASSDVTFGTPVAINSTDTDAFTVNKTGGTEVFRVDTDAPSKVEVLNEVTLVGYSDDGDTTTWQIDSGSGNATFFGSAVIGGNATVSGAFAAGGGIESTSFNSPFIAQSSRESSLTTSTTSTSTYFDAETMQVDLPSGTWTVFLIAGMQARHSNSQRVAMRTMCGGFTGSEMNPTFYDSAYAEGVISDRFLGMSGTLDVAIQFRSSSTGTSTSKNPWLFVIATRTS